MIKGVIFDLDHTLFDRYGTLCEVMKSVREHFLIKEEVSDAQITKTWIDADKKYVHFGWERMFNELRRAGIFETPLPTSRELTDYLHAEFARVAVPFGFAIPVLTALRERGLRIGLITNGSGELQRAKLEMLRLTPYFDEILISGEFGSGKPETEIFAEMSRRLGIPPEQLCYVGDNEVNDIEASRRAGYTPVWVRTTGSWEFPQITIPRYRINAIYELLQYDFDNIP